METNPEFYTFNFESGSHKTTLTRKFINRKPYEPTDPRLIYAFIPGTIIEVSVKEKQKVKKGDPLLIFQAMKMNNIIKSPLDGVVKKVHIKEGDRVPKSQVLIELK